MQQQLAQTSVTSPERPPVLPDAWGEKLFQTFEDFYGAKWSAQYGDFPRARVLATWCRELGGFADKPESIAKAIQAQKSAMFPPTLPEFLRLCRDAAGRSGSYQPEALPAPQLSREEAQQRLRQAEAKAPKAVARDMKGWAKDLRTRYLSGEKLSALQIKYASEALDEGWVDGECKPALIEAAA